MKEISYIIIRAEVDNVKVRTKKLIMKKYSKY